mmetsp:Transcript_30551/g.86363  ORF Transcript_30551/g.86363 Transcript_30551/m.86363 type:complete len:113 (-) Transcript_30551:1079-1417(-)
MDVGLKRLDCKVNSVFDLFALSQPKMDGYVTNKCLHRALEGMMPARDVDRLFFELDADHTGQVKLEDVKQTLVEAAQRCVDSYSKVPEAYHGRQKLKHLLGRPEAPPCLVSC